MAKVLLPLLGTRASGTVGDSLTFGSWKGINTVRARVIPANPRSTAQVAQRSLFSWVVKAWQFLPAPGQNGFIEAAKGSELTGFNLFSKRNLQALRGETDIAQLWVSPGMSGATNVQSLSASVSGSSITLTATLAIAIPGTTVDAVHFLALKEQAPGGEFVAPYYAASDAVGPYSATITVSGGAGVYRCWAFTQCTDSAGKTKYGLAVGAVATVA